MNKKDVVELAMKASGAVINGYHYTQNGKEPLYGTLVETEDGTEYQPFVVPPWLERFAALVANLARHAPTSPWIATEALEQERARGYREGVDKERRACYQTCMENAASWRGDPVLDGMADGAEDCAAAILERGET